MSSLATYTRPAFGIHAGLHNSGPPVAAVQSTFPSSAWIAYRRPSRLPTKTVPVWTAGAFQTAAPVGTVQASVPSALRGRRSSRRASEEDVAPLRRARVQDRTARPKRPAVLAGLGVDGVDHAGQRADEHVAVRHDRLDPRHQAFVRKQPVPLAFKRRPDFRRRRPAPPRVVRQHGPIRVRQVRGQAQGGGHNHRCQANKDSNLGDSHWARIGRPKATFPIHRFDSLLAIIGCGVGDRWGAGPWPKLGKIQELPRTSVLSRSQHKRMHAFVAADQSDVSKPAECKSSRISASV